MTAGGGADPNDVHGEIRVELGSVPDTGLETAVEEVARSSVLEHGAVSVVEGRSEPGEGRVRVVRGCWSSRQAIVAAATEIERLGGVVRADGFAFAGEQGAERQALAPDPLAMTGFESYLHEDSGFFGEMYGFERRREWMLMADRLRELRTRVVAAASAGGIRMDDRKLDSWFSTIAGRFVGRNETMRTVHTTRFSITTSSGTEWIEGSAPGRETRNHVQEAFRVFNAAADGDAATSLERSAFVVSCLYTSLLRIHPYPDLNCRTSWVALSAALTIYGLPSVVFAQTIVQHDEAIAPALRSSDPDAARPFAELLCAMVSGLRHH